MLSGIGINQAIKYICRSIFLPSHSATEVIEVSPIFAAKVTGPFIVYIFNVSMRWKNLEQ